MPSTTDPNLGLNYGWDFRESGWKTGMDANLKKLGAVVCLSVKAIQNAPPASPINGDRYIIGTGSGAWAGKDNQIAVRVAGAWEYYTPQKGWLAWNESDGILYVYTTAWASIMAAPGAIGGTTAGAITTSDLKTTNDTADAELSGAAKVFLIKDSAGTQYYFKAYPTKA